MGYLNWMIQKRKPRKNLLQKRKLQPNAQSVDISGRPRVILVRLVGIKGKERVWFSLSQAHYMSLIAV